MIWKTEQALLQEYLRERAKLIDLNHRNSEIYKGYPEKTGNTVYFSVVDEEGNACSFIVSPRINYLQSITDHTNSASLSYTEFYIHALWCKFYNDVRTSNF